METRGHRDETNLDDDRLSLGLIFSYVLQLSPHFLHHRLKLLLSRCHSSSSSSSPFFSSDCYFHDFNLMAATRATTSSCLSLHCLQGKEEIQHAPLPPLLEGEIIRRDSVVFVSLYVYVCVCVCADAMQISRHFFPPFFWEGHEVFSTFDSSFSSLLP